MKMHRACLFATAALGAVILFGCGPAKQTKFDTAKDLQNDGKYAQAIAEYKAFIAERDYKGLLPFAQYNIARSYRMLGNMPEARAAYAKVIENYPESHPAEWSKAELKELDKLMENLPPAKPMPMGGSTPGSTTPPTK